MKAHHHQIHVVVGVEVDDGVANAADGDDRLQCHLVLVGEGLRVTEEFVRELAPGVDPALVLVGRVSPPGRRRLVRTGVDGVHDCEAILGEGRARESQSPIG